MSTRVLFGTKNVNEENAGCIVVTVYQITMQVMTSHSSHAAYFLQETENWNKFHCKILILHS